MTNKCLSTDIHQPLPSNSLQAWDMSKCYPERLLPNENYWYLTMEGWIPWNQMDFRKMSVGVNIFMVVHSYFATFIDPSSFTGSSRPVWTASDLDGEFGRIADNLVGKFGSLPKNPALFHEQFLNSNLP